MSKDSWKGQSEAVPRGPGADMRCLKLRPWVKTILLRDSLRAVQLHDLRIQFILPAT